MKHTLAFLTASLVLALAACSDTTLPAREAEVDGAGPAKAVIESCTGTICGPVWIHNEHDGTEFYTWTASASGGTAPYSYSWTIDYEQWGSGGVGGNSSSVTFGVQNTDGPFTLFVTVRDANNNVIATGEHAVRVCTTYSIC